MKKMKRGTTLPTVFIEMTLVIDILSPKINIDTYKYNIHIINAIMIILSAVPFHRPCCCTVQNKSERTRDKGHQNDNLISYFTRPLQSSSPPSDSPYRRATGVRYGGPQVHSSCCYFRGLFLILLRFG